MQWIAILCGGGIGALLRFVLATQVMTLLRMDFPYGIFVVNSLGCFLIGCLAAWTTSASGINFSDSWRAFLIVGFCGGFTTFSSFSLDTINLLAQSRIFAALFNVFGQLVVCLCFTWLGMCLMRLIGLK